jgi:ankyrin repeat protein
LLYSVILLRRIMIYKSAFQRLKGVRKNPDTDIKNNDGNTALMMATKARKVSIMKVFNKHERELVRRNKTLFVNEMMKQKYGFVMTPDTMEQLYKELKKESPPNGGAKSHRKRKTGKANITKKRGYRNQ